MIKILDKTKDSILVKMPISLESHVKMLSRGFEVLTPAERRSLMAIKAKARKEGYVTHESLLLKYGIKQQ